MLISRILRCCCHPVGLPVSGPVLQVRVGLVHVIRVVRAFVPFGNELSCTLWIIIYSVVYHKTG